MAEVELVMPKMGESIMEATILKWLKAEGDEVEEDEPILEIATDKVDSEVPSPTDGVIGEILYEEDTTVEVGEPIAIIKTEGEEETGTEEDTAPVKEEKSSTTAAQQEEAAATATATAASTATASAPDTDGAPTSIPARDGKRFYSPLVRNIAETEGVSKEELQQIEGTGLNGRVTKKDILQYLEEGRPAQQEKEEAAAASPTSGKAAVTETKRAPAIPEMNPELQSVSQEEIEEKYKGQNVEIQEMDRMRRNIAEHMSRSKKVSPHVTSFVEADVSKIVKWRNQVKKDFQEREGQKITFTPIFMEAVIKAIKDFPKINASVEGDKIVIKKDINIGMAAALPSGHLIVPVIKNADEKNLLGLTKAVNDLAERARNNELKPDEIQGGTFTLTNVGTFGNEMGTPVISQPQVAILATGAIKKKPVVLETEEGDMIGIRHRMFLSHSYDHRVIDGAYGGAFVRRVADYLEDFNTDREI